MAQPVTIATTSMPALQTETSQLLLYDPDKSRSTVHCYLARPSPLEERMLGRLFVLVEIDSHDARNVEIIEALQETVTKAYYESEDFQIETAFERALQKTNERLPGIVSDGFEEWIQRLNIIIGVLKDTALHFTVVGRLHAYLIHRQRIVDILESSSATGTETVSPLKVFVNIISGQLNFHDTLFFCTTSILDYLSQEKIKRIVSEHSPADTTRTLEGLLTETDGGASFGAIVLTIVPAHEVTAAPEGQEVEEQASISPEFRSQQSMERLITREQKTNELLTHSLWPNLGRIMKKGVQTANSALTQRLRRGETNGPERAMPDRRPQPPQHATRASGGMKEGVRILGRIAAGLLGILIAAVRGIAELFRGRRRAGERFRQLPSHANRTLAAGSRWYERLSVPRRRLLLVALVLIILFAQSVVWKGRQQDNAKRREDRQALVTSAREKIDAADAALLIQNESGARKLLKEATDALAGVPVNDKSLRDDVAALTKTIDEKMGVLRHSITVQPESIVDLGALDVGLTARSIALVNTAIYSFNEQTNTIYRYDLSAKKSDVVADAPSFEAAPIALVPNSASSLYLLLKNGKLQEVLLKEKTVASVPVQYESEQRDIRSAVVFNNRLYTLDAATGQIFRHQRAASGFGLGTNWITEAGVNVQIGVAMAIDGSVFVAKEDGTVEKFLSGKKDTAVFDTPDPALTRPTTLFTNQTTANLYILDQEHRRLLEYEKTGKFLRQYVADQLTSMKDVVVQGTTAYILNGTVVYSFPLTEGET